MRLAALYRLTFGYTHGWSAGVAADSEESEHFYLAEGRADGLIAGRFVAANAPHRRGDGTYEPDLHGVIETADGDAVLVHMTGYGRAYPVGRRQIVGTARHFSDADGFRRLNDAVCVVVGEVRAGDDRVELVADVAELVWEPLPE
jgi:hypothetical protein